MTINADGNVHWRCFHCDEVFTDEDAAREHFGPTQHSTAACQIDIAEYRRMEMENRLHCEEDTPLHRALYAAQGEAERRYMRGEEDGYDKGLRDAKTWPV